MSNTANARDENGICSYVSVALWETDERRGNSTVTMPLSPGATDASFGSVEDDTAKVAERANGLCDSTPIRTFVTDSSLIFVYVTVMRAAPPGRTVSASTLCETCSGNGITFTSWVRV